MGLKHKERRSRGGKVQRTRLSGLALLCSYKRSNSGRLHEAWQTEVHSAHSKEQGNNIGWIQLSWKLCDICNHKEIIVKLWIFVFTENVFICIHKYIWREIITYRETFFIYLSPPFSVSRSAISPQIQEKNQQVEELFLTELLSYGINLQQNLDKVSGIV